MRQIYICTDTVTGLCSALHDAWKENRDNDAGIEIRGKTQQQLFCEYRTVAECEQKALRLERMIKRHMGYNTYWDIYHALLADDGEKGTAVFKTMQASRDIRDSHKIMDHLSHPDVAKVFALSRSVSNEAHMYEEFIRFRELENGILFSEITPKAQVLTCVADHFADRFPLENWMIYDRTHQVFLVHRRSGVLCGGRRWIMKRRERCRTRSGNMNGSGEVFLNPSPLKNERIQDASRTISPCVTGPI